MKLVVAHMMRIFIFIIIASCSSIANVSGLNSPQQNGDIVITVLVGKEEYRGGEEVNISINVKNPSEKSINLDKLQFQVLYAPLDFSVLKGEMAFQKTVPSDGGYSLSKKISLPDYAPSGRYIIIGQLVGIDGNTFGSASDEIIVEANYVGIGKAFGVFLLYVSVMFAFFTLLFYSKTSEEESK